MSDQPLWDDLTEESTEDPEAGHTEIPDGLLALHVVLEQADVTPEEFAAAFKPKGRTQ